MSRLNRYFFYSLVFLVVVAGLAMRSYTLVGIAFVLGIALGLTTEYFDNRRDEKYKHYNTKHQFKH